MSNDDRAVTRQPERAEPDAISAARHDVIAARQRVSSTVSEIEARVSGTVASAKRKVDVVTLAREHPWPALGAAFLAGIALGTSGADRKAATATMSAAKRAPDGAKQGAKKGASLAQRATAAGLSYLASSAMKAITSPVRTIGEEMRNGVNELPRANTSPVENRPSGA